MNTASHFFRTKGQRETEGYEPVGNGFHGPKNSWLPLYEGKMVFNFNHRFADYNDVGVAGESTQLPTVPVERLSNPEYSALPRYWVDSVEAEKRIPPGWRYQWFVAFRDI